MLNINWFAIHAVDHCNQKCLYCNNHSPFLKKREYSAEEYIPHIDKMLSMGIRFKQIRISGGEPFLHSNLLDFVQKIKKYNKSVTIASNLFWLKNDVDNDVFKYVDVLFPSIYPHNVKKVDLIKKIQEKYKTRISYRIKSTFLKFEFTTEPEKVTNFCRTQGTCTNLLVSGKLSRCATAAFADTNPAVSQEFLTNRNDIFFDLYDNNYSEDKLKEWIKKWPLDACSYCTLWKEQKVKWTKFNKEFV